MWRRKRVLRRRRQLNRSASDSRVSAGKRAADFTRESWLRFKDDVDNALQKKPNQAGFYKNLADMMHNKMEMLDQVSISKHFYQIFYQNLTKFWPNFKQMFNKFLPIFLTKFWPNFYQFFHQILTNFLTKFWQIFDQIFTKFLLNF